MRGRPPSNAARTGAANEAARFAAARTGAATGAAASDVGWNDRGLGALALLVALLVVVGHVRPAVAYPFSGVALLLGWVLAMAEAVLVARRAGVSLAGAAPAGAALAAFVAWCWARTAFSAVPTDGAETLTTLLEGLAAFWVGAFLVAAGRAWRSGVPGTQEEEMAQQSRTGILPVSPDAGMHPEGDRQDACPTFSGASAVPGFQAVSDDGDLLRRKLAESKLAEHCLTPESLPLAAGERFLPLLFAVVAACVALYAIVQYHYLYPLRFVQESARYAARLAAGAPSDPVMEGVLFALKWLRVGATFGNPNVLAGFLAVCVPLLAVAPWTVPKARHRAMAGACAAAGALLCYAAYCTGSAGGMLVLAVALGMTVAGLALRRCRVGAWLAVGAAVVGFSLGHSIANDPAAAGRTAGKAASQPTIAATAVVAPAAPVHFSFVKNLKAKLETIRERRFYLQTAWRLWLRAPWTGHGLGAYGRLYGQERVPGAGESQYAHNVAAQMAVETGLVGLAAAVAFVGLLARRWGSALRTLARGGSPVPAALGAAAALFLLDSLGELTFYDREVLLDACLLAGGLCAAMGPRAAVGASAAMGPSAAARGASQECGTAAPGCESAPSELSKSQGSHGRALAPARQRALWVAGAAAILATAGLAVVGVPSQMGRYWIQTARDAVEEVGAAKKAGARADRDWWADQALRAANRAVWWQPGSPGPYQMRSGVAGMLQRPGQAETDLRYALSLNPQSARLHSDLADWTLRQRPNAQGMGEAMALVDEAVALHPLKSTYHEQRARLLASQGRRDEALAEAREAVRLAFQDDEKTSSRAALAQLEEPEKP
jgi:tetratricopeptide (TPR) repeat protein